MSTELIAWGDDLLSGSDETDREHRELVSLAAALQTAIAGRKPSAELARKCEALLDFTRKHFAAEEGRMLARGYPRYEQHRDEHRRLLEQLGLVRQNLSGAAAGELMLTIISAWTLPHIRSADKQFAEFLKQHGLR